MFVKSHEYKHASAFHADQWLVVTLGGGVNPILGAECSQCST